jgi:hypothetical protein
MSFSPREDLRRLHSSQLGASVLAALVLVALLVPIASVINMSLPKETVSPQTQGALAGSAIDMGGGIGMGDAPTVTSSSGDGDETIVCKLGYDYSVEVLQGSSGAATVTPSEKFQICHPAVQTEQVTMSGKFAPAKDLRVACDTSGNPTTVRAANNACEYAATDATRRELIEGTPKWKCWVRIVNRLEADPSKKCVIKELVVGGSSAANKLPSLPNFSPSSLGAGITTGSINKCDEVCKIAAKYEMNDSGSITLDKVLSEREHAMDAIQDCESGLQKDGCTEAKQFVRDLDKDLAKLAESKEKVAIGACANDSSCDNPSPAEIKARDEAKAIRDTLKDSVVEVAPKITCSDGNFDSCKVGQPCSIDGRNGVWRGVSGGFTCVGTGIDNSGAQAGSGAQRQPGICGSGTPSDPIVPCSSTGRPDPSRGNTFGAPGQGMGQSPITGGQCTQGYVCQGNTLYYQSVTPRYASQNPIVIQEQCITQPVQQCQFGCSNPMQQMGQGGNSTMGEVAQGIGLVRSVLGLFGGGNAGGMQGMQSNSCATQQQAQQQQAPFGQGNNGQACMQPPQQPDPAQCTSGSWRPVSSTGNGCTTGWQCVPSSSTGSGAGTGAGTGTSGTTPIAQLSCQPKNADVGMTIGFSFSCGNATGSSGTGFSTGGLVSGTSSAVVAPPPASNNIATYTLTCINLGVTASEQCQVQVTKPGIVMVVNPQKVASGENATVGWVTSGMKSCVISSPDQNDFTQRNAGNFSVNGAATTSPITGSARFNLNCETMGGDTRSASTSVMVL